MDIATQKHMIRFLISALALTGTHLLMGALLVGVALLAGTPIRSVPRVLNASSFRAAAARLIVGRKVFARVAQYEGQASLDHARYGTDRQRASFWSPVCLAMGSRHHGWSGLVGAAADRRRSGACALAA